MGLRIKETPELSNGEDIHEKTPNDFKEKYKITTPSSIDRQKLNRAKINIQKNTENRNNKDDGKSKLER